MRLFFLHFDLPKVGVLPAPETCAIVRAPFLGGADMPEALCAALESVPVAQLGGARTIGPTRPRTLSQVALSQAMRQATPVLVSDMALADLMYVAEDIIGQRFDTIEPLLTLVVFHVLILSPVSLAGTLLDRKVTHGRWALVRGATALRIPQGLVMTLKASVASAAPSLPLGAHMGVPLTRGDRLVRALLCLHSGSSKPWLSSSRSFWSSSAPQPGPA